MNAVIALAAFLAFIVAVIGATSWKEIAEKRLVFDAETRDKELAFDREVAERRLALRAADDNRRTSMLEGVFDRLVPAVLRMMPGACASPSQGSVIHGPWPGSPDPAEQCPPPAWQYTQSELDTDLSFLAVDPHADTGVVHDRARAAAMQLGQLDRYIEALRKIAERQKA